MAIRDEARVLEIVEEAQTDQWRPTLYSVDFGECVCVWEGLPVGLVTRAVTQTHSAYGVFITEG